MLKKLLAGWIGANLVLVPFMGATPAIAQNPDFASQECSAALASAENLLVNDRRLWITNVRVSSAEDLYDNYPYQRPAIVTVVMGGDDVGSMLSSPQLLTSITQTITSGCSTVGLVRYAMAESDWSAHFGVIGNRIREFECVDPGGDNNSLQWGTHYCL